MSRRQQQLVRRYHTGHLRPKNPNMRNPNYFCNNADVWEAAARRASGLGPSVRWTSRKPSTQKRREEVVAACLALRFETKDRMARLFAAAVCARTKPLPGTEAGIYEYLAHTVAEACDVAKRTSKDTFAVWYDWESFAYSLHGNGILFTPYRCALIAMRGFHIYRLRNWRRRERIARRGFPLVDRALSEIDAPELEARKDRARSLALGLKHRVGRKLRWPWSELSVGARWARKFPRPLPDRSLPRTPDNEVSRS